MNREPYTLIDDEFFLDEDDLLGDLEDNLLEDIDAEEMEMAGLTVGEIVTGVCREFGIATDSSEWPTELSENTDIPWPI